MARSCKGQSVPTALIANRCTWVVVTGVDNRLHQTRVNGYQFVLAVARVAPALFAPTPCASVTVCDHPTPCASVTVCDGCDVGCGTVMGK